MRMDIKPSSEHLVLVVSTRGEDFWKQILTNNNTIKYWSTQFCFFKSTQQYSLFFITVSYNGNLAVVFWCFCLAVKFVKCVLKHIGHLTFSPGCKVSCLQKKEEFLSPLVNHNSNTVLWLACFAVEKAVKKLISYMKHLRKLSIMIMKVHMR